MNRQIANLMGVVVLLFALLIGFTSRWTVFEAESLENETANRRPLLEQAQIPRGRILTRDREVIARDEPTGRGEGRIYRRVYPLDGVFSHPIGYSFISRGRAGLERSRNDALAGDEGEFASILEELRGGAEEGDDVVTALDARGQRAALDALAGRKGSVVAIEPATGKVRVMASVPTYDQNTVDSDFASLNRDEDAPLVNRATQSLYPPGSTFKVVTAAAALDSGKYTPDSIVSGKSPKEISGVPLQNAGNQDFGPISLTQALTNSVNTVWAEVAVELGKGTMYEYMERFGFGEDPPLDYPDGQLAPSGVYSRGRILDEDDAVDIGRVAIGQERLLVTPLQMAMVAAAVANGGELMEPRLTERVVRPDGRVRERVESDRMSRVMKKQTAERLAAMMSRVVEEGTGTAAALEGISVAGKTGTAEVEGGATNQAWFIAFAPVERPRMAIAVTVERTQGQGGTVAAPIAKRVLEALLR